VCHRASAAGFAAIINNGNNKRELRDGVRNKRSAVEKAAIKVKCLLNNNRCLYCKHCKHCN
jgi:hypothetical protein